MQRGRSQPQEMKKRLARFTHKVLRGTVSGRKEKTEQPERRGEERREGRRRPQKKKSEEESVERDIVLCSSVDTYCMTSVLPELDLIPTEAAHAENKALSLAGEAVV